jgi:predicted lipid-binding transport protein (Tim44 family)
MLDWERNWRGAGIGFAVLIVIAGFGLIATFLVFLWVAVLSGFLVWKFSPAKAPDRAAVPSGP